MFISMHTYDKDARRRGGSEPSKNFQEGTNAVNTAAVSTVTPKKPEESKGTSTTGTPGDSAPTPEKPGKSKGVSAPNTPAESAPTSKRPGKSHGLTTASTPAKNVSTPKRPEGTGKVITPVKSAFTPKRPEKKVKEPSRVDTPVETPKRTVKESKDTIKANTPGVSAPTPEKLEGRSREINKAVSAPSEHYKQKQDSQTPKPGSERRTPARQRKSQGDLSKKRGAVYHEDEGHLAEPALALRGSSTTSEDAIKGSSSDEYKRRIHELREKYREEKIANNDASLRTFADPDVRGLELIKKQSPSLQTLRLRFAVLSESLDCSIHMRRRYMQGDTLHEVTRQGLMCLYALAPHAVHQDSSLQFFLSYSQSYAGMMNSIEKLRMDAVCLSNKTAGCTLRNLWSLNTGYLYTKGNFSNSGLSRVWIEPEVDTKRHAMIWSRSLWNGLTYTGGHDKMKNRKLRVSPVLVNLVNRIRNPEKLLNGWIERFPNINLNTLSTKNTIIISQKEAEMAASIFARSTARKRNDASLFANVFLNVADQTAREQLWYLESLSKQPSSLSFLTAFVVKVVYDAYKEMTEQKRDPPIAELMSVNALKVALLHLKETRHWDGNATKGSLFNILRKKAVSHIINRIYDRTSLRIRRNATDRVTSILTWERSRLNNSMMLMELSLPHPFDPTGGTGKRIEYPAFVDDDGSKSIPYMSSAGVLVTHTRGGETRGMLAASSTGAERTVQGVANAILRMIFYHSAAIAVQQEHVYLDLSDGQVHCTREGSKAFKAYYGIKCDSLDYRKPDRTVMAMMMDHKYHRFGLFAITEKDDEYNYGVGH